MPSRTVPDDHAADARRFVDLLLPDKPADARLLVWTTPDKISRAFLDVREAADYAVARAREDEADVYVGVGLGLADVPPRRRYLASQVGALYALWADVDVAHDVHQKPNLPPTREAALAVIADAGPPPTLVVDSGHGIQAWWAFARPWTFADDDERRLAMAASHQWQARLGRAARARGWNIDSVPDLSRVLRMPGTFNRKDPNAVAPVRLLRVEPAVRYDGAEALVGPIDDAEAPPPASAASASGPDIALRYDALPPADKLANLLKLPRAHRAYRYDLPDLDGDKSASGADFELAYLALSSDDDWTDQEIVDLLIAARRQSGHDLVEKLRHSYYLPTLLNAKRRHALESGNARRLAEAEMTLEESIRRLEGGEAPTAVAPAREVPAPAPVVPAREAPAPEPVAEEGEEPPEPDDPNVRQIDELLRPLRFVELRRTPADPLAEYDLVLYSPFVQGRVTAHFGSTEEFLNLTKFNAVLYHCARFVPTIKRGKGWLTLLNLLALVTRDVEPSEPAQTYVGQAGEWLRQYLPNSGITYHVLRYPPAGHPVARDGAIWVNADHFLKWLNTMGVHLSPRDVSKHLRAVTPAPDGRPQRFDVMTPSKKRTTMSYWRVSDEISAEFLAADIDERPLGDQLAGAALMRAAGE